MCEKCNINSCTYNTVSDFEYRYYTVTFQCTVKWSFSYISHKGARSANSQLVIIVFMYFSINNSVASNLPLSRYAITQLLYRWYKKKKEFLNIYITSLPLTSDVLIGFPLRKAPQCLLAEKNCLMRGLYIIPNSTFLFTTNAKEMHVCGNRCTKFVVPSIGSIIHVGSSVSSGRQPSFAAVSSPINLKDRESLYRHCSAASSQSYLSQ